MSKQTKGKRTSDQVKRAGLLAYFGSPMLLLSVAAALALGVGWVLLVNEGQFLGREIAERESRRDTLSDGYVRENTAWNKMKSRDNVLAKLSEWDIVMGEPCYDQIVQLPLDGRPIQARSHEVAVISATSYAHNN